MADAKFSDADREVALKIIRAHGGKVSALCGDEVRHRIGKYVSDRSLRDWYKFSHQPKHKIVVNNRPHSVPVSAEIDGGAELPTEVSELLDKLSTMTIYETHRHVIDGALKKLAIALLTSSTQETRQILATVWDIRTEREREKEVAALDSLLKEFIEACKLTGRDPKEWIVQATNFLRKKYGESSTGDNE